MSRLLTRLTRLTRPCMALSPRPSGRWSLPYSCSLPRNHDSDFHEARLLGRTVYRWPRTETTR